MVRPGARPATAASLHPTLPQRSGEMLVRRRLIEDGIKLMRRFEMIEQHSANDGIVYQATDNAFAFTELLVSEYAAKLKLSANWLALKVSELGNDGLVALVNQKLGRWSLEFQDIDVNNDTQK